MKKLSVLLGTGLSLLLLCGVASAGLTHYGNGDLGAFDALPGTIHAFQSVSPRPGDPNMKEGFDFTIAGFTGTVDDESLLFNGNAGFQTDPIVGGEMFFSANTVTIAVIDFGAMNFIHTIGFFLEGHNEKDDHIRVTAILGEGAGSDSLFQQAEKHSPSFFGFHTDTGYIRQLVIEVMDENMQLNNANGGFETTHFLIKGGNVGEENVVPEPATLLLCGLGATVFSVARGVRRKKSTTNFVVL